MLCFLYDIHGNLPALEAVLADAREGGADRFVLGGDYALFGAWPAECVELLRGLDGADWIRGNGERWTAHRKDGPEPVQGAIDYCRERLGEETVRELGDLPMTIRHGDALFCHASPRSDVESFLPEPAENEPELLRDFDKRKLVFGHTHLQFQRVAEDGTALLNPGSVGMPFDGDHRAAYATVSDGGEVALHRVGYDWEASVAAIRDRLGEAGEMGARRIEAASIDAG